MIFTQEQQKIFERDGVVELGPLLTTQEVEDLRARMERVMFEAPGRVALGVRDLSEARGRDLTYSVLQLVNLYTLDEAFGRLIRRDDLLDAVQALLGPNLQLFRDQSFYKPAGHGGELFMHQDNRYWHLDPPDAVTVWIALDDATVENGCVHFVKGSHHWGQINHVRALDGDSILLEAEVDKSLAVPIQVPAGHATIHHCQIAHWSPANRSSRPRRAHTIEYITAGICQRGAALFDRPLVRGILPGTCNGSK
jgi:hypothetical protein